MGYLISYLAPQFVLLRLESACFSTSTHLFGLVLQGHGILLERVCLVVDCSAPSREVLRDCNCVHHLLWLRHDHIESCCSVRYLLKVCMWAWLCKCWQFIRFYLVLDSTQALIRHISSQVSLPRLHSLVLLPHDLGYSVNFSQFNFILNLSLFTHQVQTSRIAM